MPITAKLSRQFYEKLGDEVANELVGWFNAVDDSYRLEFRDLFESSFGRVEARLGEVEARVEARIARLETRMEHFEGQVNTRLERSEAAVARQLAEMRVDVSRMETRLIRWMFGFWIGSWITTIATVVAVQRLL